MAKKVKQSEAEKQATAAKQAEVARQAEAVKVRRERGDPLGPLVVCLLETWAYTPTFRGKDPQERVMLLCFLFIQLRVWSCSSSHVF